MEKAIVAAAEKNYKEFEKIVSNNLSQKITDKLAGFMKFLDKKTFSKED